MKKIFLFVATFFCFCLIGGFTAEAKDFDNVTPITISEGATYYESSEDFGSGRYAFVSTENIYTPQPCIAKINGYSFLDKDGNIIFSYYNPSAKSISIPDVPKNCVKTFIHFNTKDYRNGWTDVGNVMTSSDINTPAKIIDDIEDEISASTGNAKTAVVIDSSGSMSDNQKAVVTQLKNVNLNSNTPIYVFADNVKKITVSDLENWEQKYWSDEFEIGAGTDLQNALASIVSDSTITKILLISDLEAVIFDSSVFSSKKIIEFKIYDPDDTEFDSEILSTLINSYPDATIERVKIE